MELIRDARRAGSRQASAATAMSATATTVGETVCKTQGALVRKLPVAREMLEMAQEITAGADDQGIEPWRLQ
jgi:hypothetical protein